MSWHKKKNIGITEATRQLGISPERLRYWEAKGIITPAYERVGSKVVRKFSEVDISIGLEIVKMLQDGFALRGAARHLNRPYKGE
ncbi:MAG: MerR family transcriptional regulator [Candidatus Omnitrophota bacterium]